MKILYVVDYYYPHIWGVETLFENLVGGVVSKWNRVIILTTLHDKRLPKYEKLEENIEIYRVGHNRYDFMLYAFIKWIKLAFQVDIIHTSTYNSALPSFFLWYFSKKKIIITVHEIFSSLWFDFVGLRGIFYRLFERLIGNMRFSFYITVSMYTKRLLLQNFHIDEKKIDVVYNGIDYNFWNSSLYSQRDIDDVRKKLWLENKYLGVYFWRPGISKWLEYYIKSIPRILLGIKDFHTILIVPDSDKIRFQYIKDIIWELKLEKVITLIPWLTKNKLPFYILASDFVVVPSLAEGFWFSAVETCALWQKLIVSDIASLPEVVSWKVVFVEAWNIQSIANGVIKMYKGDFSTLPEKKFLWNDNINRTLKIYEKVLWK